MPWAFLYAFLLFLLCNFADLAILLVSHICVEEHLERFFILAQHRKECSENFIESDLTVPVAVYVTLYKNLETKERQKSSTDYTWIEHNSFINLDNAILYTTTGVLDP
jgi:hypothetical protein